MGDLSTHFSAWEFKCRCCGQLGELNNIRLLIDALEYLRMQVERVVNVNCGYRCPKHNAEVGGEKNSYHVQGIAADIVIVGLTPIQMFRQAEKISVFRNGGIGIYPDNGFIHIDLRSMPTRWVYDHKKRKLDFEKFLKRERILL